MPGDKHQSLPTLLANTRYELYMVVFKHIYFSLIMKMVFFLVRLFGILVLVIYKKTWVWHHVEFKPTIHWLGGFFYSFSGISSFCYKWGTIFHKIIDENRKRDVKGGTLLFINILWSGVSICYDFRFSLVCLSVCTSEMFVTEVEKWEHLCPMYTIYNVVIQ